MLNYDVIIATKDRLNDFLQFIASLLSQSVLPSSLIVVDASISENRLKDECICRLAGTKISFIYLKSLPGLTRQRNLGCKHIGKATEVVFFFDDDVVLSDPFYVEKILKRYSNDISHRIGCIFGRIINVQTCQLEARNNFHSFWRVIIRKTLGVVSRIFLISSSKIFHVLPSGMNTSNQDKIDHECFVNWQPGCCMSFRTEVLMKYCFDETLTGYSMREDLDMSYRVAKEHKLLYLPSASLLHLESPAQRLDAVRFGEVDVKSWYWFVKKNMFTINRICFWWAAIGYIFTLLLSALLNNRRTEYLRAVGGIKALLNIAKHSK